MARDMSAFEFLRQRIFRFGDGGLLATRKRWLWGTGMCGTMAQGMEWVEEGFENRFELLVSKCYILDYIVGCES